MSKAFEGELEDRCPVEWEHDRKQTFCKPHRCDLPKGHAGHHQCECGWTRRNMKRDVTE